VGVMECGHPKLWTWVSKTLNFLAVPYSNAIVFDTNMVLLKHFIIIFVYTLYNLITSMKVVASGPTLDNSMHIPGWTRQFWTRGVHRPKFCRQSYPPKQLVLSAVHCSTPTPFIFSSQKHCALPFKRTNAW